MRTATTPAVVVIADVAGTAVRDVMLVKTRDLAFAILFALAVVFFRCYCVAWTFKEP